MADWRYQNQTDHAIIHGGFTWEPPIPGKPATKHCIAIPGRPGTDAYTKYPIPDEIGLTLLEAGDSRTSIAYHNDIIVPAGGTIEGIKLPWQADGCMLEVSIFCMTTGGVLARFNSTTGPAIPIDKRGYIQTVPWESVAVLNLENPGSTSEQISVSATRAEAIAGAVENRSGY